LAKANIAVHLAQADKRIVDSADEYLQLLDVLSCITKNQSVQ
jgi:hypothetical protein